MGCCFSRDAPASGSNPAPIQADGSQQALAPSTAQSASIPSQRQTRPNARLKPINPDQRSTLPNTRHTTLTNSTDPAWTRKKLEKQRSDFWDSRVSGSPESWGTIRVVVQLLQTGELQQAQAILDASELTCPTGDIWRGVYDQHGDYYKVDEYVVIEPEGLVDEEDADRAARVWKGKQKVAEGSDPSKGGLAYEIRCRLSSTQQDIAIGVESGEPVGGLLHKLRERAGIPETTHLRIAYGGKFYEEHKTLESNPRFDRSHVLNVMVFEPQPSPVDIESSINE